jgi:hypothetical protein
MTRPDWDDERLDAAFHARFERRAPESLAHDVHVRIAGTSPARLGVVRLRPAWSVAIAAVVVVAVAGTVLIGLGGLGPTGGQPAGSDASASLPGGSASPTEQALPGSVQGLPIVDIRQAIRVRDAGADDSEIAVRGWFTPAPPVSCDPAAGAARVSPVQTICPDQLTWLTEDAESLVHVSGDRTDTHAPNGLGLNPYLDGLATDWFPALPGPGADGGSTPADVVFLGHFDDRRAELCPRDEIDACRDRFVVDAVAFVHGVAQPASVVDRTSGAVSSVADIESIVATETPASPILSMTVVDGATGLAAVEPSLGTGQAGLIDQARLWVVRVLEGDRVVTYVVIDGSDAIYELNSDGDAILVGGTPPTSEATGSPAPWPPAGARVIALTSQVGAGKPPVRVAVVDRSGRLTGVGEKGTIDPSSITLDQRIEAYAELEASPGRVHLVWVGGICDSRITVTVAEDLKTITFDMGPAVACDSIGIERQLVLDFSGLVEVPSIALVDSASGPVSGPVSVPSASPGYELDCGPLGPDTCETLAEGIVAANAPKEVVSITFLDECGSSTTELADGTGTTASIDCIPGASPR